MSKDTLIAEQALEIGILKKQVARQSQQLKDIHMLLICIGGPLNDNYYGYNSQQMTVFSRIEQIIEGVGYYEEQK